MSNLKEKFYNLEDVTIDFVGDSITWGLNHCSPDETYTAVFAKLFAKKFNGYKVSRFDGIVESETLPISVFEGPFVVGGEDKTAQAVVVRNGVGGNTVRRALHRQNNFIGLMPNGKYADVTFLMFGINDALYTDKDKFVTPERFEKDYIELVGALTSKTGSVVIIVSPSFNGVEFPLGDYAAVTEKLAGENSLPFIDLHGFFSEHYMVGEPNFGQGQWLSDSPTDSCHLSPKGAEATAEFLFEEFCKIIGER